MNALSSGAAEFRLNHRTAVTTALRREASMATFDKFLTPWPVARWTKPRAFLTPARHC